MCRSWWCEWLVAVGVKATVGGVRCEGSSWRCEWQLLLERTGLDRVLAHARVHVRLGPEGLERALLELLLGRHLQVHLKPAQQQTVGPPQMNVQRCFKNACNLVPN